MKSGWTRTLRFREARAYQSITGRAARWTVRVISMAEEERSQLFAQIFLEEKIHLPRHTERDDSTVFCQTRVIFSPRISHPPLRRLSRIGEYLHIFYRADGDDEQAPADEEGNTAVFFPGMETKISLRRAHASPRSTKQSGAACTGSSIQY